MYLYIYTLILDLEGQISSDKAASVEKLKKSIEKSIGIQRALDESVASNVRLLYVYIHIYIIHIYIYL
jgi:hypothetical protein